MSYSKFSIFTLIAILTIFCGCTLPKSYSLADLYAKEFREIASEKLKELEENIPTEPICRIGIIVNENQIVCGLSPFAQDAGFLLGDHIIAIEGQEISSEQDLLLNINKKRAGETIEVTVERDHDSFEIDAICIDGHKFHKLEMDLFKAASEGNWDKCITLSYEAEGMYGRLVDYAAVRMGCSEAKRRQNQREPDEHDAELHYEYFIREIDEFSRCDSDSLKLIQQSVNNEISWLEYYGFNSFAKDLKAKWEIAIGSKTSNYDHIEIIK